MEERRSVGGGELAGESLARTQVSTVAPGTRVLRCTGYSITSPRCQPCRNRSPHPVRPPDACSPLFIITFPSLSNYRSLCPREGTRKTEGDLFFPFSDSFEPLSNMQFGV